VLEQVPVEGYLLSRIYVGFEIKATRIGDRRISIYDCVGFLRPEILNGRGSDPM
jgi:hypothetical protein